MRTVIVAALLLVAHAAHADVAVRIVDAEASVLDGGVWGDRDVPIAGATVRIVGDAFVVVVHTDASGQFSVGGLAPGIYRVQTDRGRLIELSHLTGTLVLDREPYRCDLYYATSHRAFEHVLTEAAPPPAPRPQPLAPRGHVDTRSTAQGVRIDAAALRALP